MGPVRVGNAAGTQRQHDVYGHVLAAASHCYHHMDMESAAPQAVLNRLADLAARRWHRPDDSIWEVRGRRAHHTYSHLMCWLAIDRAVDLAAHGALAGDSARWAAQRDAARQAILERAWDPILGAFTGTLGGGDVDAAALVAPLIGFLPPDDPRCRSTRRVVTDRLGDNGLLHRYCHDDGLGGRDAAFLLCTLWLADTHTVGGRPRPRRGAARACAGHRQRPRTARGGGRPGHGRPAGQLPAGTHPSRGHRERAPAGRRAVTRTRPPTDPQPEVA
ncbi:MAG: hypothetical protein H0V05_04600 [Euzebyaceae bacterium]|nr:hypothetical protein [Euzebyaceae bacterium]